MQENELKGILKWPLLLAAVVTVVRVILERIGAPYPVPSLFSVVMLHLLIVPLYFAIRIARSGVEKPIGQHFKLVIIYVVLARAMILPTYWLARVFHWPDSRFAGTWGENVTPFVGFVAVPLITGLVWVVASTIIGGGLGAALIAIMRKQHRDL